jgi:hypothetical protein
MMAEKHLHNLVDSDHYKLGDFISKKEDEHCALEEGRE